MNSTFPQCLLAASMQLAISCATPRPPQSAISAVEAANVVYSGAIIDTHCHVRFDQHVRSLNPDVEATAPVLLAQMDRQGIQRAGLITMAKKANLPLTRKNNNRILALCKARPKRFFPIISVHPADGQAALEELQRVHGEGAQFLKLHPNTQALDVASQDVQAIVRRSAELRMIVLFDGFNPFDPGQVGKLIKLALEIPGARIIIAHVAGPHFHELASTISVLNQYSWYKRNIWVDVSAMGSFYSGSPYAKQFAWSLRQIGMDRVLFGSDFPFSWSLNAVQAVRELGFSREEQQKIFFDNAAVLLKAKGSQ